jgi:hypothetical protein
VVRAALEVGRNLFLRLHCVCTASASRGFRREHGGLIVEHVFDKVLSVPEVDIEESDY